MLTCVGMITAMGFRRRERQQRCLSMRRSIYIWWLGAISVLHILNGNEMCAVAFPVPSLQPIVKCRITLPSQIGYAQGKLSSHFCLPSRDLSTRNVESFLGLRSRANDSSHYFTLEGGARPIAQAIRAILTSGDAKSVRKAIATICDYHETKVKSDPPIHLLLAMMAACRATGDWRRCLSLLRKINTVTAAEETRSRQGNGADSAVLKEATSIAIGACARWGAEEEAWSLVDKSPWTTADSCTARPGLSLMTVMRLWMLANGQVPAPNTTGLSTCLSMLANGECKCALVWS